MATQNILPTLQADEKSAQMRLHPVPVPNGLYDAGRMLTDAGQGLQKASFGLMLGLKRQEDAIRAREDSLVMTDAKNEYNRLMTLEMAEIEKLNGVNAVGTTDRYKEARLKARDKIGLKLRSTEQLREFNLWEEQQDIIRLPKVMGHEYENSYKADVQSKTTGVNDSMAVYQMYGGSDAFAQLEGAAKELYAAMNGSVTDERAVEFYNDAVRRGEADEKNREKIDREFKAWTEFRQGVVDKAVGSRAQWLLDRGDVEGAIEYYNDNQSKLSDSSKAILSKSILGAQQVKADRDVAQAYWDQCVVAGGERSLAGRYLTEQQAQMSADIKQKLAMSSDPRDKAILANFETMERATVNAQKANLALDKAERTAALYLEDTYEAICENITILDREIGSMPDNVLRDDLQLLLNNFQNKKTEMTNQMIREQNARTSAEKAEAREQAAAMKAKMEEWEKDPVRKALGGNVVMQASRSDGIVTIGNDLYHINDEKERKALFLDYGYNGKKRGILSKTDMSLIDGIAVGDIRPEGYTDACYDVTQILKVLNPKFDWTIDKVSMIMPDLVNDYVRIRADWTNGGTNKGKPISDALNKWIINRLAETRDKNWWIMNEYAAHKYLQKAWNADGTVDTKYLWNAWENYPGENVNKNIRLDSALNSAVSVSYPDNTNRTRVERQKDSTFDAIYGTRGDNR